MKIKFIWSLLLLIIQYGSCLDERNCTNTSITQISFAPNPTMKFYLFTNKNFFIEQEVFVDNVRSLIASNFNSKLPVRIIIHGWRNYLMSCVNGYIKDAYLKKGNFNVFVVDWSDWAQNLNYFSVVPLIFNRLGRLLTEFLKFLNKFGHIQYDNIYMIGHSLGAHMAGSAGYNLRPNQVNTIYGLDPAGLNFQGQPQNKRLDKSHAKYVEQISTNMGELGYTGLIGHAGFYPNYGRLQPYCIRFGNTIVGCSHALSYWYFAESITTSVGFCSQSCGRPVFIGIGCPAVQCRVGQKILMGGEPSTIKNGTFYLKTNNKIPFAQCNC